MRPAFLLPAAILLLLGGVRCGDLVVDFVPHLVEVEVGLDRAPFGQRHGCGVVGGIDGVDDDVRQEELRQHGSGCGRRALREIQVQRHADAVVHLEPLGDHGILGGPVRLDHLDAALGHRIPHGVGGERGPFVRLAAQTPVGGEIDEQRLAFVDVADDALGREVLEFEFAQCAGGGLSRDLGLRPVFLHLRAKDQAADESGDAGGVPGPSSRRTGGLAVGPQSERQQQGGQQRDGHGRGAELATDDPEQPQCRGEHGEREYGAQFRHPRTRSRQHPAESRGEGEQQVGERETKP